VDEALLRGGIPLAGELGDAINDTPQAGFLVRGWVPTRAADDALGKIALDVGSPGLAAGMELPAKIAGFDHIVQHTEVHDGVIDEVAEGAFRGRILSARDWS